MANILRIIKKIRKSDFLMGLNDCKCVLFIYPLTILQEAFFGYICKFVNEFSKIKNIDKKILKSQLIYKFYTFKIQ